MQRGKLTWSVSGATARWGPPAKWRTRSAPTPKPCWPSATGFHSTWPFPLHHRLERVRSAHSDRGARRAEVLGAGARRRESDPVYVRIANPPAAARNPGFDVTPPELITGSSHRKASSRRARCGRPPTVILRIETTLTPGFPAPRPPPCRSLRDPACTRRAPRNTGSSPSEQLGHNSFRAGFAS